MYMYLGGDVKVKEIMGKCWNTNGGRGNTVWSKWFRITSCCGLAAMAVEESQGVPHDSILSKVETLMREIGRDEEGENLGVWQRIWYFYYWDRVTLTNGNVQKEKENFRNRIEQVANCDWLLCWILIFCDAVGDKLWLAGLRQRFNVKCRKRFLSIKKKFWLGLGAIDGVVKTNVMLSLKIPACI